MANQTICTRYVFLDNGNLAKITGIFKGSSEI